MALRIGWIGLALLAAGPALGQPAAPAAPAAPQATEPASAQPAEPEIWIVGGVSAAGRVNMRAEPSTAARLVTRLPNGTRLRNLGCREVDGERWCRVEPAEGTPGWIVARFLRDAAASAPARDAARPETAARAEPAARPVPNRPFDAMGTLPCAMIPGQPTRDCAYGVMRSGSGTASIQVTGMAGLSRWIYFEAGLPARSDGAGNFAVERLGDLFLIRIGAERFEVPLAVAGG